MPTALDRAMHSKNLFLGFAGMVTAAAAWVIWDPETWTAEEMKRWLSNRGLMPNNEATREELLERVKANLRIPPRSRA
ncbi:hypothetical protein AARAC_005429 [Aspergillus arachidicola]|uniref:Uncharacterized protein n=1 Tax=Aspergillus arachidicola TaxID=656916 RepID=A0A2G7GBL1_9EURO|nr:hypothetical protein AARAC_005429 [Aspergillus arachidicola]